MSLLTLGRNKYTLIYFFPFFMDMVAGVCRFVCLVRAAKLGCSAKEVAGILTITGLSYFLVSPIVGRVVKPENAAGLMMISCLGQIVLCGLFVIFPGVYFMYVLSGASGILLGLFFIPFQVFMKVVDGKQQKTLACSVGMYTFFWSMGLAIGQFVSGYLMELGSSAIDSVEVSGWKYCYLFGAIIALITVVGVLWFKTAVNGDTDDFELPANSGKDAVDYSNMPDLAWLGWIGSGVGILVLFMICSIFPKQATLLQFTDSAKGNVFFLISFAQAITGLLLCQSKIWMYQARKVFAFGVLGILGTILFCLGKNPIDFYFAAVLYGIYGGSFFFYLVFHSLAHPQYSAIYVSYNEAMIGICGVVAPLFAGFMADYTGFTNTYLLGLVLVVAVTVFQFLAHRCYAAAQTKPLHM